MTTVLTLARRHWRKLAALGAIAVAFLLGRASVPETPARVETRERVVYQDRIVEKRVEVKVRDEAAQQTRIVYRDRLIEKDGTRHEREIETTATDTQAHERATAAAERVVTRDVVRDVEKRVEVQAPQPQWRVGALAGFDVRNARLLSRGPGPPIFGALIERRVIGPVSVGAWGLHTGQGGLVVTLEF